MLEIDIEKRIVNGVWEGYIGRVNRQSIRVFTGKRMSGVELTNFFASGSLDNTKLKVYGPDGPIYLTYESIDISSPGSVAAYSPRVFVEERTLERFIENFDEYVEGSSGVAKAAAQEALDAKEELTTDVGQAINELNEVKESNRKRYLDPVETVDERDSKYPTPENGDSVWVSGEGKMYRYNGTEWKVTNANDPSAIDMVSQQLADKPDKTEVISALSDKRDKSTPIGLNDADTELLAAIEGGEGTSFNLLSDPREKSVSFNKLSSGTKNTLPVKSIGGEEKTWEIGSFNSGGFPGVSTTRMRTDFIEIDRKSAITLYETSDLKFNVYRYNIEDRTFIASGTFDEYEVLIGEPCFVRILLAYKDNRAITEADLANLPAFIKIDMAHITGSDLEGDSISRAKIKENAVSVENTDFVKIVSSNIFDVDKVKIGTTVKHQVGYEVPSDTRSVSGFIKSKPLTTYSFKDYNNVYVERVAFYDKNQKYISQIDPYAPELTFDTPARCEYFRVVFVSTAGNVGQAFQLNESGEKRPYEPYRIEIRNYGSNQDRSFPIENLMKNGDGKSGLEHWESPGTIHNNGGWIARTIASPNNGSNYIIYQNMADKLVNGDKYYAAIQFKAIEINSPRATVSLAGYFPTTRNIPIEQGQIIKESILFEADTSKTDLTFSTRFLVYDATGPATVGIRYALLVNLTKTFGEGHEPKIEEFEEIISKYPNSWFDGTKYDVLNNREFYELTMLPKVKKSYHPFSDDLVGVYLADEIEQFPNPLDIQHTEMYTKYDTLMASHPSYITKELLGTESTGLELYKYTFTPHKLLINQTDQGPDYRYTLDIPKVVITAGVHGDEKSPVFSTYLFFEKLCNDWRNDKLLEFFRFNVEFVVIPIVNPSGFNTHTRGNPNGVNLNRDFPAIETHSGEGKELETQLVMNVLRENTDAEFLVDFHNMAFRDGYISYVASYDETVNAMANKMIATLGREWQKKYPLFPQEVDHVFGYTAGWTPGTLSLHANTYGMKGVTLEIARAIWWQDGHSQYDDLTIKTGLELLVNQLKGWMKLLN